MVGDAVARGALRGALRVPSHGRGVVGGTGGLGARGVCVRGVPRSRLGGSVNHRNRGPSPGGVVGGGRRGGRGREVARLGAHRAKEKGAGMVRLTRGGGGGWSRRRQLFRGVSSDELDTGHGVQLVGPTAQLCVGWPADCRVNLGVVSVGRLGGGWREREGGRE